MSDSGDEIYIYGFHSSGFEVAFLFYYYYFNNCLGKKIICIHKKEKLQTLYADAELLLFLKMFA